MPQADKQSRRTECTVYSRVNGWFSPVRNWNPGKREEYKDRVTYDKQLAEVNQAPLTL